MSLPLPTLMQAQLASVAERLGLPLTAITPQQAGALTFSDFIVDNLQQHPAWWQQLQQQPPQPDEWRHYAAWLAAALQPVDNEGPP